MKEAINLTEPEAERKARLNQPRMTRAEALRQFQGTTPLHPSAQRELRQSSAGSVNGPKNTAN